MSKHKPTLERIVWLDHTIKYGDLDPAEARGQRMQRRESVGWVIKQTAEEILLAHTKDPEDHWADVLVIGTALVVKREELHSD